MDLPESWACTDVHSSATVFNGLRRTARGIISHLTKTTLHFRKEMGMHFLYPLGFVLGLLGRDAVHLPSNALSRVGYRERTSQVRKR